MTNKEKQDYIQSLIDTHHKMASHIRLTKKMDNETKRKEIKNINNMLQYLTKVNDGLTKGNPIDELINFNEIQKN